MIASCLKRRAPHGSRTFSPSEKKHLYFLSFENFYEAATRSAFCQWFVLLSIPLFCQRTYVRTILVLSVTASSHCLRYSRRNRNRFALPLLFIFYATENSDGTCIHKVLTFSFFSLNISTPWIEIEALSVTMRQWYILHIETNTFHLHSCFEKRQSSWTNASFPNIYVRKRSN